jgi:hypothetical protein
VLRGNEKLEFSLLNSLTANRNLHLNFAVESSSGAKMVTRDRGALAQKSKVRGRPFKLGNPGRPPGSKNKTTRVVEQLVDNQAEKLTRKLVELALAGDVRCLQY